MLKVPETSTPHGQGPGAERPVGELVHQLIEDGKAYARAEVGLVKAIASAKASALVVPVALIAAAVVIGLSSINALVFGVVLALAKLVGPLAAGLIGMLIFAAIAGVLAWVAIGKIRSAL